MFFLKTNAEKELDSIIQSLEMNMSNNYKDNAQANLRELDATLLRMKSEGKLKGKKLAYYEGILADYQTKMKGYSHREQTPYWT